MVVSATDRIVSLDAEGECGLRSRASGGDDAVVTAVVGVHAVADLYVADADPSLGREHLEVPRQAGEAVGD